MKKILVVDDQAEIRDLIEAILRRGDYEVFKAENGQQAIEMARKHRPDLIMMDVMMPGAVNGLDATRVIKSDPETARGVVIILTAKGESVDREKGLEAGAHDYFAKPFSPLELMRKVDELLEGSSRDKDT